ELVATACPRRLRVGATHSKVNGHNQFAIANDDQHEHAINTADHAMVLATVPVAHQLKGLTVFAKHGVINDPCPRPATVGSLTHRLDVAPKGAQDILAKL